MDDLLIGNDTAVITMLLLFIAGLLTKRFVPWWVYEDVVRQLKEYEEAAPELITEVKRLMILLEKDEQLIKPQIVVSPRRRKNPARKQQREGANNE